MRAEFLSEGLKGRDHVADLITDGRTILTCVCVCVWLASGSSARFEVLTSVLKYTRVLI
jgi:hypothetical protein